MRRIQEAKARWLTGVVLLLLVGLALPSLARMDENSYGERGPRQAMAYSSQSLERANRTIDVGLLWITITNFGYFGNDSADRPEALIDPCTDDWAIQAEYPGGSNVQYLYRAGLWIGAMIQEEGFEYPRVSVGTEGWFGGASDEFDPAMDLEERTIRKNAVNCLGDFIYSEEAISEQDFVTSYTDTSRYVLGTQTGKDHPIDGPHVPLGIKVTQTSYAWSYNYAQDFVLIDYEIENIADKFLKNVYVGLYVDADVGLLGNSRYYEDDICGFTKTYEYTPPGATESELLTINTAWISDNDGRPRTVDSGSRFSCPDVTGTRVVRAPNPKLRTSFNWWISNGEEDLDYGPSWQDDGSEGDWTRTLGTPISDPRKYFVLSNREFDFDQTRVREVEWVENNPQEIRNPFTDELIESHPWKSTADEENREDLANGYDTRYMISWGPLGIYDFTDEAGNRIYRLNPGEKFSMTIAYVAGAGFHDRNDPQPTNNVIDQSKFDFADFQYNADWAAKVYDNPMIDTWMRPGTALPLPESQGGEQDNWFGEDVGIDGVFADSVGLSMLFYNPATGNDTLVTYPGPDQGEQDGRFQLEEDSAPRPRIVDYTFQNELFDQGDGVPDFQGPPPPPTPVVDSRSEGRNMILTWGKKPAEDPEYRDPFSRQQDFEGYRIYVSNSGQENEFSLLAEFDKVDFSYYSASDSLMDSTYYQSDLDSLGLEVGHQKLFGDVLGTLQPIGLNTGMAGIAVTDSTYEYVIENANPLVPRYYAVTAFDYGDYRSGTEPLESAKTANSMYVAPDGNPSKKPAVVPNPYRADRDYTRQYLQLTYPGQDDTTSVSWENRNDGTAGYFPQTDRRIYFFNLPRKCLIRIFTVSGDLVQILEHDPDQPSSVSTWSSDHAEAWNLNNRNNQQVASGLYFFSVEDKTDENEGHIDVGKFVIIR